MLEYLRMKREIRDLKKKMAELEDKMIWLERMAAIPMDELRGEIMCIVSDIRNYEARNAYLKETIGERCSNIEACVRRLNRSGYFSEKYADNSSRNTDGKSDN